MFDQKRTSDALILRCTAWAAGGSKDQLRHDERAASARCCTPIGMGKAADGESFRFFGEIVLDATNHRIAIVQEQVGRAPVAVIGKAHASCVDEGPIRNAPYIRMMDVRVDRDEMGK